jgi:hypothetical protein
VKGPQQQALQEPQKVEDYLVVALGSLCLDKPQAVERSKPHPQVVQNQ